MSEHHPQSENMKALEQSLNDHMQICALNRKVKRLKAELKRYKDEVERLCKAGDAVCESPYALETDPAVIEWRAATEGKPSV